MIIGSNFNKKCDQILIEASKLSGNRVSAKISVKDLNKNFDLDRNEMRNILEYMQNLELIEIETIGGPLLYGHISLTSKGVDRILKIKNKRGQ
ncbi:MAG: hypothetical protein ACFCU6_06085 [Balneolaceae bacterium]